MRDFYRPDPVIQPKVYHYFWFCLTSLFSRNYSRLGRVPERKLFGLPEQDFSRLDADPVTQPTMSKR